MVESPHRLAGMLPIWMAWRAHPVGTFMAAAARNPQRTALIDDEGSLTFAELDGSTTALARAWAE